MKVDDDEERRRRSLSKCFFVVVFDRICFRLMDWLVGLDIKRAASIQTCRPGQRTTRTHFGANHPKKTRHHRSSTEAQTQKSHDERFWSSRRALQQGRLPPYSFPTAKVRREGDEEEESNISDSFDPRQLVIFIGFSRTRRSLFFRVGGRDRSEASSGLVPSNLHAILHIIRKRICERFPNTLQSTQSIKTSHQSITIMQSALRRGATGGAAHKSAWRAMILRRRHGSAKNADTRSHQQPRQHAVLVTVRVLSSSSMAANTTQQQPQPQPLLPWAAVGALALLAGVTTYSTTSSSTATTTMGNDHGLTAEQQHHPQSSSGVAGAKNIMLHRMRSTRGRSLNDKYNIDWTVRLGEGAYGSVHPARLRATGEKVALKKINRGFTNAIGFKTETDALLRIYDNGGHPNINGLRDMYEDHKYYYLILDLVSGGEMFEHLVSQGAYSEADAARLMHEVASALAFLHGVGVVHCDLKPENLLLSTKNRLDGTIKMIDFGCAIITSPSADDVATHVSGLDGGPTTLLLSSTTTQPQQRSSTGTTAYWSPERFTGPDNTKRDITAAVDMVRMCIYTSMHDVMRFSAFFLMWLVLAYFVVEKTLTLEVLPFVP
jgi:hypothetical protein